MPRLSAHQIERLELVRDAGLAAASGSARRAALAEHANAYLREKWAGALDLAGLPHARTGVTLAVVGSQARAQAGPLSDYDLVLLHDGQGPASRRITRLADGLWYPLWDDGVRFDHSVRTLGECRKAASDDLAVAVGMLDLRPVAGDDVLVAGVRQAVAADWRGEARKRLPELLESMRLRHERFGDLASTLEPDLKEAGGGLRDLALLDALATAWLADPPRVMVEDARAILLDVRDAIHAVTQRGRSRLALQDQDAVAHVLGLTDADELLTRVAEAGRRVDYVVDMAVRSALQSQRARRLHVGPRRPAMTSIGHGMYVHDGEIVLGGAQRGSGHVTLLRAARQAATRGLRIAPSTLSNLVEGLSPVPHPWPAPMREAFVDLLASGPGLVPVWESLDRSGAVDRWFPEWVKVRSRRQRNSVHRFTVDRHIIETCAGCEPLLVRVSRPDLLCMAAFLHDIGKVAGQRDHSLEGAPVARAVCERMGFPARDAARVEVLVRQHLVLGDTATHRDPHDPGTLERIVEAVDGDSDVLDLLAALTEADARAAGEAAWSSWRAGLVVDLVERVHSSMPSRGGCEDVAARPAAEIPADDARRVRGGDVVLRFTPTGDRAGELIVIDANRSGWFADVAGLLSVRRLDVRAATVDTLGALALGRWAVEAPHETVVDIDDLARALRALRGGERTVLRALDDAFTQKVARSRTRRGGPRRDVWVRGIQADEVGRVRLEVRARDEAGFVFQVAAALARAGCVVSGAEITTTAGRCVDVFTLHPSDSGAEAGSLVDRAEAAVRDVVGAP